MSSFNYCREWDDEELLDYRVLRSGTHTARTAQLCDCGGWIKPGEKYTAAVVLVDGDFVIFKDGAHDHDEAVRERDREYDEAMAAINQADLEHQIKVEGGIATSNGTKADTCTGCGRCFDKGEQYVIDGDARRCSACEGRHNFEGTDNDPTIFD